MPLPSSRQIATAITLILAGVGIGSLWRENAAPVLAAPAVASVTPVAFGPKTPVTEVVRKVSPAVVTVGAVKRRVVAQPWFDNYFMEAPRAQRTVQPYMGSGFIVDASGLIVTNFHVIEDSESLFVTLPDGRQFNAKVVDADRYVDIALLQVETRGEKLPKPLEFANPNQVEIGELAIAFGNPFGTFIEDARPTVTVGYVSALNRNFRPDQQNQRVYQDMIQTDAAINPGNSGGPLVDAEGRVMGVNTFIFSTSGASVGIGFAIPGNRVKTFVEEIRKYGRLQPLLLDFSFRGVMSAQLRGVRLFDVKPNGPAQKAGLAEGDILIEADGRSIGGRDDFYLLFAGKQAGDKVRLKVWRDGEVRDAEYTVVGANQK